MQMNQSSFPNVEGQAAELVLRIWPIIVQI